MKRVGNIFGKTSLSFSVPVHLAIKYIFKFKMNKPCLFQIALYLVHALFNILMRIIYTLNRQVGGNVF